jgi:hypothetical protein
LQTETKGEGYEEQYLFIADRNKWGEIGGTVPARCRHKQRGMDKRYTADRNEGKGEEEQ